MTMFKILGNAVFGQKKAPAGWFHSKTKVGNTFPTIPDPMRTKLYLKIYIFIANLLKIWNFELFWIFGKLQKCARRNFTQNGPVFMPRSLI